MTEQTIDFTQSLRRILLNPIVPLSVLDIFCRTAQRAQATLLGKIYSDHIEIIQIIPVQYTTNLKIDYQQHMTKLKMVQQLYPSLEVVGSALTDININSKEIPILHSVYQMEGSGFKSQGILRFPIVMSIGTNLSDGDYKIQAYSFSPTFKFCHQLMGMSAFEQWNVKISFGDLKLQGISPIYTALRDQEQYLPSGNVAQLVEGIIKNLKLIRRHVKLIIDNKQPSDPRLGVALKKILSFDSITKDQLMRTQQKGTIDTKLIVYLSSVVSAQNLFAQKLNKLQ